jgi:hypothetical protein
MRGGHLQPMRGGPSPRPRFIGLCGAVVPQIGRGALIESFSDLSTDIAPRLKFSRDFVDSTARDS